MSDHNLKFASESEARSVLGSLEDWHDGYADALYNGPRFARVVVRRDGFDWITMGPHVADVVVLGVLYTQPTDGSAPVALPGFHVNLRCQAGLPSSLAAFEVFPATPRMVWL